MDNTLQQGITAAKNGDKSHAYELLTRAAQDVSTAEQAWLWLSSVVDADSERLYCLNYVLRECFEIGWVNLMLWTNKLTQPI